MALRDTRRRQTTLRGTRGRQTALRGTRRYQTALRGTRQRQTDLCKRHKTALDGFERHQIQIQIQIHVFRNKSTSVVFHYYTSINLILHSWQVGFTKHTIHKNTCEHSVTLHSEHINLTFTDLDTTNCRCDRTLHLAGRRSIWRFN